MASLPEARRGRVRSAIAAGITLVIGFVVHRANLGLPLTARDVLGDALWAVMIFYLLGALLPRASWSTRTVLALAICFAVELSQLYRQPQLDALRTTRLGHLFLGQGFDPRDLLAYALGIAAAATLERVRRKR